MPLPSRPAALALVHRWVESESLRHHMYAVEAAMRAYARKVSRFVIVATRILRGKYYGANDR